MEKKAVVLSGGGSRGAYQVGVWKALRKLHYRYKIDRNFRWGIKWYFDGSK